MIAPCGIEIKVGQEWTKRKEYFTIHAMNILLKRVYMFDELFSVRTGKLSSFTHTNGGYKLVKDV